MGNQFIATTVGGLPEVVEDGVNGYLVPPENSEAIAESVIKFLKNDEKTDWNANIKNNAFKFSWETMVDRILGLIKD